MTGRQYADEMINDCLAIKVIKMPLQRKLISYTTSQTKTNSHA